MTENEAINELQANIDLPFGFTVSDEASEIAIQALEEIQQYRAIGTVEELKSMKENGAFTGVELAQLVAMQMRLKEYSAIGTIEEFKDLKEKNEPKKVIEFVEFEDDSFYSLTFMCPACNSSVFGQPYKPNNCKHCGANLDWQ